MSTIDLRLALVESTFVRVIEADRAANPRAQVLPEMRAVFAAPRLVAALDAITDLENSSVLSPETLFINDGPSVAANAATSPPRNIALLIGRLNQISLDSRIDVWIRKTADDAIAELIKP